MAETSNVAAAGMFSEKFPSMSVNVPVVVPLIRMLAPTTGRSLVSVTLPEMPTFCAISVAENASIAIVRNNFFFMDVMS